MIGAAARIEVFGLDEYWARSTGRKRPTALTMADRMRLDALGLGLEQTMTYLRTRPAFEQFEAWILATAGPPDPIAIARYHAWLLDEPPPAPVARRIADIDEASDVLDAADLAQWEEQGHVILRQAISREEAAAAAALLWRVIGADPDAPESWYGPRDNGIMIQHFQDPALEVARRSARIHKAFAQLWGTADLWTTVDRMSFNPPERPGDPFPGPELHWDVSLAQPIPMATQGILYLTDTDPDQGALRVVPGFHHRVKSWLASLGDADPRQIDLDGEAIAVGARAGDLVIWHQALPHGASPNRTPRPRMAQYVNMYSPELWTHPVWR